MSWTPARIGDLTGRTVLVTGANSGLGYEATRELARKGAHIVMACRSTDRGERARTRIEREIRDASLSLSELDLADLDSVREFAAEFTSTYDDLSVLINRAGLRPAASRGHLPARKTPG